MTAFGQTGKLEKSVEIGLDLNTNVMSWLSRQIQKGPTSSFQPSQEMPFQRWYKFKEAFSPSFVVQALEGLSKTPKIGLDPFGGSGTTALTCQFLGITPYTIEVNPFLADVIESKLINHDTNKLIKDFIEILKSSQEIKPDLRKVFPDAPKTLYEPGDKDRWIFDRDIMQKIASYIIAIDNLESVASRLLFKVLLGSLLIENSNVYVNGKGRRYRKNWKTLEHTVWNLENEFQEKFDQAINDINRHFDRKTHDYTLLRGSCLERIEDIPEGLDFALFSPPYPNSFDYTDIYNVELWALGYLQNFSENKKLREQTLRSHVQIRRDYDFSEITSRTLNKTLKNLDKKKDALWSKNIPAMIGAYFADLNNLVLNISQKINDDGVIMLVVGDSSYQNILIDVPQILTEVLSESGIKCIEKSPIRSMRASAQQGGQGKLGEYFLKFKR